MFSQADHNSFLIIEKLKRYNFLHTNPILFCVGERSRLGSLGDGDEQLGGINLCQFSFISSVDNSENFEVIEVSRSTKTQQGKVL